MALFCETPPQLRMVVFGQERRKTKIRSVGPRRRKKERHTGKEERKKRYRSQLLCPFPFPPQLWCILIAEKKEC